MKKLKPNQLGPFCSFCPPKTKRAVYRQDGFSKLFSCEEHKEQLTNSENSNHSDTEADYQIQKQFNI